MEKKRVARSKSVLNQKQSKGYWPYLLGAFLFLLVAYMGFRHPPDWLLKYIGFKSVKELAQQQQAYYYGLPGEPVKWPAGQVLRGIDVSRYQTHVNWPEVKKARIEFVFIKATEGFWGRDRLFERHWARTGRVGILRGAYHFYRPNQPAWLQAINFLAQVNLDSGDLPPVLDVEQLGDGTEEELRENIRTWLKWVEWRYGTKPVIYTNYSFYKDYLYGFFEEYPLWIAHYKVDQLKLTSYDRPQVKFWQHSDRGAVPGIGGRVDCNVFYGTKAALQKLCLD